MKLRVDEQRATRANKVTKKMFDLLNAFGADLRSFASFAIPIDIHK
jgi:hypothetical protein